MPTKSRWIPTEWNELPGLQTDALHEAWNAWLKNCERPSTVFASLCRDVRQLSIATADEQRAWLMATLQPYRIEALGGGPDGMLTAYYEPLFDARRLPGDGFNVPLYKTPAGAGFGSRKPWFSRQQIETLPEAQAAPGGPRHRLDARSRRCAGTAHPGLGPAQHHRAQRHAAHDPRGLRGNQ